MEKLREFLENHINISRVYAAIRSQAVNKTEGSTTIENIAQKKNLSKEVSRVEYNGYSKCGATFKG